MPFSVFSLKFSPPGSGSGRENECGSGSTALEKADPDARIMVVYTVVPGEGEPDGIHDELGESHDLQTSPNQSAETHQS